MIEPTYLLSSPAEGRLLQLVRVVQPQANWPNAGVLKQFQQLFPVLSIDIARLIFNRLFQLMMIWLMIPDSGRRKAGGEALLLLTSWERRMLRIGVKMME